MKASAPRFLRYILAAVAILFILLLLFINSNLAALAEMLYPGSGLWTHAVLAMAEILAIGWFWRGLFRGPRHLLLMDKDTPEAKQAFARELTRRMRGNPYIRQAGIVREAPFGEDDDEYLKRCLAVLKEKADAEIKQNARRIFLATALSQNGRLDALIVFVSLCRLVWRVSSIYNQRPHPSEIASLYWAVVSSTFLAFSIEELDIATEISIGFGESFQAMAPAGLTASIPFAGKALQTFTSSTIDGATNCYLALRAGIITRNAYFYGARGEEKPSRAMVFREAGSVLFEMSQELVGKVAGAVASNIGATAKNAASFAGAKTAQAGKGIMDNISRVGQGISSSAGKIATGTANTAGMLVTGTAQTVNTAGKFASGAVNTAGKLASGTVNTAGLLVSGTAKTVNSAGKLASDTVESASRFASDAMDSAGKLASGTADAVRTTGNTLAKAGTDTARAINRLADKTAAGTRALFTFPSRLLRGQASHSESESKSVKDSSSPEIREGSAKRRLFRKKTARRPSR